MRFQFGSFEKENRQIDEIWVKLKSPKSRKVYLLAGLVGLMIPGCLIVGIILFSLPISTQENGGVDINAPTPWGVVLLVLLLYVPLHEIIHAVFQPGMGLTTRTTIVVWPKKVRVGVYYDGCISRRRWILMRLAPLVMLSIIPAGFLLLFKFISVSYATEIFTEVLMLVNGIGSGGDVIAVGWVLLQVPRRTKICFANQQAYWQRLE